MTDPSASDTSGWIPTLVQWLKDGTREPKLAAALWRIPAFDKILGVSGGLVRDGSVSIGNHEALYMVQPFEDEEPQFIRSRLIEWPLPPIQAPRSSMAKSGRYVLPTDLAEVYERQVSLALDSLSEGTLDKVVLAIGVPHEKTVTLEELIGLFARLLADNPDAFVHLTALPGQIWIGASPEVILARNDKGRLTTMALAGTHTHPGQSWTFKECAEHESVAGYIADKLSHYGVAPVKTGPYEVAAAGLYHLRTEFLIEDVLPSSRALDLVQALHPTPALSGYPVDKARALISDLEGRPRGLYAGMIGPVMVSGVAQEALYANLRCACLDPSTGRLTLWAGAGLNARSVPAQERAEIEAKLFVVGQYLTGAEGASNPNSYSIEDSADKGRVTAATDEAACA